MNDLWVSLVSPETIRELVCPNLLPMVKPGGPPFPNVHTLTLLEGAPMQLSILTRLPGVRLFSIDYERDLDTLTAEEASSLFPVLEDTLASSKCSLPASSSPPPWSICPSNDPSTAHTMPTRPPPSAETLDFANLRDTLLAKCPALMYISLDGHHFFFLLWSAPSAWEATAHNHEDAKVVRAQKYAHLNAELRERY
ncbi:hypothetical protein B0H13DRAFT_1886192 [Mycena leptocephala]|nr:hypothetical protein B0H13DRAFT_1886192 [Mycena leptocephala]